MDEVKDLVQQLKEFPKQTNEIIKKQKDESDINTENAEDFIITTSSKLIQDSLHMIQDIKDMVYHEPNAENVAALADLIKASTGAIDALSKVINQNKKSKTQIDIKAMDIKSKQILQNSDQEHSLKLSRGELLKQLLNSKEIIDVSENQSTQ